MGQINEARKAMLQSQLAHAVATQREDGYWDVFVPSAIREFNTVKADDEASAKQKVFEHLSSKIDLMPETDRTQTTPVEIAPDNIEHNIATSEV